MSMPGPLVPDELGMPGVPAPTCVAGAIAAMQAGLAWLASADPASLPAETLAQAVRALVQAESSHLAARSRFLSAFNSRGGCEADGQATTRAWLHWQTRITRGAAGAGVAWMKRLAVHPRVADALATEAMSVSWAREVCDMTDKLPPDLRDPADDILLTAAAGGADLADLRGLAREMYERTAPPDPDDAPPAEDEAYRDRWLRLDQTFQGAGRLEGALTPECTAVLMRMLDSLSKKAGPEDDRSAGQRNHDALEEAARMLLATGDLPDVAGQPAQVLVHVSLDQVLDLLRTGPAPASASGSSGADPPAAANDEGEPLTGAGGSQGNGGARGTGGAFAAGRAAGDGEPGWLTSAVAARAYACDSKIAAVVTGHLDPEVVAAAVRAYLTGQDDSGGPAGGDPDPGPPAPPGSGPPGAAASQDPLQATLVRYATGMLSGPAGLASALRSGLPGPLGAAVSLPLDITSPTATVPPHLRRAVIARDRHCAFPGCHRQPARCQAHHVIPRSQGGVTALTNLVLLCSFHHLYLIHRRGWTLALNADGTTTATSPDRRKTLHSHPPPAASPAA